MKIIDKENNREEIEQDCIKNGYPVRKEYPIKNEVMM